jgi:hypothetical protein
MLSRLTPSRGAILPVMRRCIVSSRVAMATYRDDSSGRVPLTSVAHVLPWNKVGKTFSADGMVATSGNSRSRPSAEKAMAVKKRQPL